MITPPCTSTWSSPRPDISVGYSKRGPPLLHNPPQLEGLCVGNLPSLSQEFVVVGVRAAPYYKLRLIGAFAVGRTEARVASDDDLVTLNHHEKALRLFQGRSEEH